MSNPRLFFKEKHSKVASAAPETTQERQMSRLEATRALEQRRAREARYERERWARKRSKFNIDRSRLGKLRRTLDGVVYDSAAERDYAAQLEHQKKMGIILSYRRQVPFVLKVNGTKICTHYVDFTVLAKNGVECVREVKGHETEVWKLKHKLFEACYPDIPYVVVNSGLMRKRLSIGGKV